MRNALTLAAWCAVFAVGLVIFACGGLPVSPEFNRPGPDGGVILEGDCPFRLSLPDGGSPCTGVVP